MDLLFRMRRKASIVAFNDVLPSNFKLLVNDPDRGWIAAPGVFIDEIANFELVLPTPTAVEAAAFFFPAA